MGKGIQILLTGAIADAAQLVGHPVTNSIVIRMKAARMRAFDTVVARNFFLQSTILAAEQYWQQGFHAIKDNVLPLSSVGRDFLRQQLFMWRTISLVIESIQDFRWASSRSVKDKVRQLERWLNEQAAAASVLAAKGSAVTLKRKGDELVGNAKRPQLSAFVSSSPEVLLIIDRLKLSQDEQCYLDSGSVPSSSSENSQGPSKPSTVKPEEMKTLMVTQSWLSDTVVDAYLSLLCQHANGTLGDSNVLKPGASPKFFAWTALLPQMIKTGSDIKGIWPPPSFPDAKIDWVTTFFFPLCLDHHWVLIVLTLGDDFQYSGRLISGLPGYKEKAQATWDSMTGWLLQYIVLLNDVELVEDFDQPRQQNGSDCGVFILGEVRRLVESWPKGVVVADHIDLLRRRFALELGNWRLS